MNLVIDVPLFELPPSPNRARGMHWAQRGRATKQFRALTHMYALQAIGLSHLPRGWAYLSSDRPHSCAIEVIYPASRSGPLTDPDSALARLKPLIDGLVDAGCLRGDGPNDVAYEPIQQRKEGKQLIVRFTLSEASR